MRAELPRLIDRYCADDGVHETPCAGVHFIKASHATRGVQTLWPASLSIVVQGGAELTVGLEPYRFGVDSYVATPIDLIVTSRIFSATPERPYLSIKIDLGPDLLNEALAAAAPSLKKSQAVPDRSVFIGKTSDEIQSIALHLAQLFAQPPKAQELGPRLIQDIICHLLKTADGPGLAEFSRPGAYAEKLASATRSMKTQLSDRFDASELIRGSAMSRSSFFKYFKRLTAASPTQFQKQLRLLEARHLMISGAMNAETAAEKVGYKSPTQFSREYARMFGAPPLKDTRKARPRPQVTNAESLEPGTS